MPSPSAEGEGGPLAVDEVSYRKRSQIIEPMNRDRHNTNLTVFSQKLRKNMTREERHLWYDFLRGLPFVVHRQYVIGSYIADFYIPSKSVVIELDGGQHFEPEQMEYDRNRDQYMADKGLTVLRYSNADINSNFSGVCEDIMRKTGIPVD